MIDEIMLEAEEGMDKAIDSLKTAFASVRTGRANAMILDKIRVDYYGVPTPINQMAAIKTPDAHLLVIEPWDKGVLGAIEHAIMQSNIGVTPSNDGTCLRLPFPSLTEERRREFVKQCKTYSEEARVRIRAVRRDANDDLEKAEKAGDITEDEQRTGEKQVQKLTDQYIAKVDELFKKKESDIMTI